MIEIVARLKCDQCKEVTETPVTVYAPEFGADEGRFYHGHYSMKEHLWATRQYDTQSRPYDGLICSACREEFTECEVTLPPDIYRKVIEIVRESDEPDLVHVLLSNTKTTM